MTDSPLPFRLYSSLSREVTDFTPIVPGEVSIYVCGMTVYDDAHIGHARAMVVFDALVRRLRARGWRTRFVRNYTDVDDKIIARAAARGVAPADLAAGYIDAFRADCSGLGLLPPDAEPRVSTSMPAIVGMIEQLVARGHAYEAGGSVWFQVDTCPSYGCLSRQKPDEMRGSPDVGHKHAAQDFALWKAAKPGEPTWDSPWGPGRPGWHIECSAMIREHLGDTVDIHGGGLDLIFPHHENELAQSTCATGHELAHVWMHNGLLNLVDGAKMSKSLGNVVTIRDALVAYPAEALRIYYLQAHYRSPLPYEDAALPDALGKLARLYEAREVAEKMVATSGKSGFDPDGVARALGDDAIEVLRLSRAFEDAWHRALDDDFNTAQALGHAFELARAINRLGNHPKAKAKAGPIAEEALDALAVVRELGLLTLSTDAFQDEVKAKRLGALGLSRADVEQKLADRATARAEKDWARADALRVELDGLGIVVMDRADGVDWRVRV